MWHFLSSRVLPRQNALLLCVGGACILWSSRARILHWIDITIAWCRYGGRARRRSVYLEGNFRPVHDELFKEDLPVEGKLPAALDGLFIRNGPNPAMPVVGKYHWFDGDGMVHGVRIRDGRAAYSNHFVRTSRFEQETKLGYSSFAKFGDMKGFGYLIQMLVQEVKYRTHVLKRNAGHANTSIAYHASKLMACEEGDVPYQLRVACSGLIDSIGRVDYGGKLQHAFTAHPKIDNQTGEMFFFGYSVEKAPYCIASVVNAKGDLILDRPITIPHPVMMHDCALTQNHFVVVVAPLLFKPELIAKGKMPFDFDKSQPLRFGLLPRHAQDESSIRWFEVPAHMIFHTVAAFEQDDVVKIFAASFVEFSLDIEVSHFRTRDHMPRIFEYSLNLKTGEASTRLVHEEVVGDFPVIPAHLAGQPVKYGYIATMDQHSVAPGFEGVAKLDLQAPPGTDALAGVITYPEHIRGGEVQFVASGEPGAAEDDGYLVSYLHNEKTDKSEFAVFNAKTMDPEPIARVKLPRRVPYGFHGLHITEAQLKQQLA